MVSCTIAACHFRAQDRLAPTSALASLSMLLRLSIHPQGLTPFEAAKAWHLRHVQKLPWRAVREQVRTSDGGHPRRYAVVNAVRRISEQRHTQTFRRTGTASTAYHRCGRKPVLSPQQKSAIVAFVKQWRSKRFCTAAYIVQELRLSCSKKAVTRALNAAGYQRLRQSCSKKAVTRALNAAGYQWRPVCKRGKLTDAQLAAVAERVRAKKETLRHVHGQL